MAETKINLAALSESARTGQFVVNMLSPANSDYVEFVASASHGFSIQDVQAKTTSGSCDILIASTSGTVELDSSTSAQTVSAGSLTTLDGTGNAANRQVDIGDKLAITISNISSPANLVVQVNVIFDSEVT